VHNMEMVTRLMDQSGEVLLRKRKERKKQGKKEYVGITQNCDPSASGKQQCILWILLGYVSLSVILYKITECCRTVFLW